MKQECSTNVKPKTKGIVMTYDRVVSVHQQGTHHRQNMIENEIQPTQYYLDHYRHQTASNNTFDYYPKRSLNVTT